ncbi:unnamed protein product [Mytilus coruscus]|uniref:Uncharacterized protein n=1 Tax=Mytilus coruscus TaxID=42192 RepID=A0A6J8CW67_MYTCO|nr:unnamed protein product [Mytilus coruscus]
MKKFNKLKRGLDSQVVFGVNCVTKKLEKDSLQLIITCKSANPPILTQHLIGLSKTRKSEALCINNLSKTLSDTIHIKSVAIGFLKTDDASEAELNFKEFIDFVKSVVPKAWTVNKKDEQLIKKYAGSKEGKTIACLITEQPAVMNTSVQDYSRFYVYKKDVKANTTSFGDDFIAFMSDSDVQSNSEEEEVRKKTKKFKNIETDKYTEIDNMSQLKGFRERELTGVNTTYRWLALRSLKDQFDHEWYFEHGDMFKLYTILCELCTSHNIAQK